MKYLKFIFKRNNSSLWKSLPLYIKAFALYFIVLDLAFLIYAVGSVYGLVPAIKYITIYGLYTTSLCSGYGLIILTLYSFKAIVACSLLLGKKGTYLLGFIDGSLGIIFWSYATLLPIFAEHFNGPHILSFEILLLIPYNIYMGKSLFNNAQNPKTF
jgi:hypothetical protein